MGKIPNIPVRLPPTQTDHHPAHGHRRHKRCRGESRGRVVRANETKTPRRRRRRRLGQRGHKILPQGHALRRRNPRVDARGRVERRAIRGAKPLRARGLRGRAADPGRHRSAQPRLRRRARDAGLFERGSPRRGIQIEFRQTRRDLDVPLRITPRPPRALPTAVDDDLRQRRGRPHGARRALRRRSAGRSAVPPARLAAPADARRARDADARARPLRATPAARQGRRARRAPHRHHGTARVAGEARGRAELADVPERVRLRLRLPQQPPRGAVRRRVQVALPPARAVQGLLVPDERRRLLLQDVPRDEPAEHERRRHVRQAPPQPRARGVELPEDPETPRRAREPRRRRRRHRARRARVGRAVSRGDLRPHGGRGLRPLPRQRRLGVGDPSRPGAARRRARQARPRALRELARRERPPRLHARGQRGSAGRRLERLRRFRATT